MLHNRMVECEGCGWKGENIECIHEHHPGGTLILCPECGGDSIVNLDGEE